jgi:Glycosyltransferase 61
MSSGATGRLGQEGRWAGRWADVVSQAYTAAGNYLDYGHPNFSDTTQMSTFRRTFKESGGRRALVVTHDFAEADVLYAGAWSRVRSDDERAAAEFTAGAVTGLVGEIVHPVPDPETFTPMAFSHGAAVLADSGYNIHHFLWEHMPAIWLHADLVRERSRLMLGMGDFSEVAFAPALLRLLGLDIPVTPMPLHSRVTLEDVTALGTFPFRVYPVDLVSDCVDRIRGAVAAAAVPSEEVIFLGRGDRERNRRALVNEDAVIEQLRSAWPDLLVVRPALQPVDLTVAQMRRCRVLVGPTGGALAHALWAPRLELAVEIVPHGYPGVTETQEAAEMLGFDHVAVRSDQVDDDRSWVNADQRCRLEDLSETLLRRFS